MVLRSGILAGLTVLALVLSPAWGVSTTYIFSQADGASNGWAASATFGSSGQDLEVTLVNTSPYDVVERRFVLTALFFDIAGSPALSSVDAILPPGVTVVNDSYPPGGDVGGEWAFLSDLGDSDVPGDAANGISSTGLGDVFGRWDRFDNSTDLDPPASPNGVNYGIVGAADVASTFSGSLEPLIMDQVVFRLTGLPAGFDARRDIRNVWFQYGTSRCEPSFEGHEVPPGPGPNPVPEPVTALAVALSIGGLGDYVRRRRLP